jgi:hypothetical protein
MDEITPVVAEAIVLKIRNFRDFPPLIFPLVILQGLNDKRDLVTLTLT